MNALADRKFSLRLNALRLKKPRSGILSGGYKRNRGG